MISAHPVRRLAVLLLASALTLSARAQTWERTRIELKPDPAVERIDLSFPFTNDTGKPLRLATVSSSCHVCLTATADARAYAPGEIGKVKASLSFAGLSGRQEKTITVTFADSPRPPATLTLILDLPNYLTIEKPDSLVWTSAEPPVAKTVLVRTIVKRPRAWVESVTPAGTFKAVIGTNPMTPDAFVLTVTPELPKPGGPAVPREATVWVGVIATSGEKYFEKVTPSVR